MNINFLQYGSKWLAVEAWTKTYGSIDPYPCCLFQIVMSKIIYILPFSKASKTREGALTKQSPFLKMCLDFWQFGYKMGKWGALPLKTHRGILCPCVWEGSVVPLLLSVQTLRWSLVLVLPVHPLVVYFKQIAPTTCAVSTDRLQSQQTYWSTFCILWF